LSRPVLSLIMVFTLAEPNKTCFKSWALMSRRNVALFGATIVSVIYGIIHHSKGCNATVHRCLWFYLLRVSGAMLFFGCLGCLCRRKK
jgi:hypothetical protein